MVSFLYLRILFWKNYRFTELYIRISSNIKRSHVPFATFFPVVTSCKYPITTRILKLIQSRSRTLPSPQGPSCCPFRVTQTFTQQPEPLAALFTTVSFQEQYINEVEWYVLFAAGFFTQCNSLQIHRSCQVYQVCSFLLLSSIPKYRHTLPFV